MSELTVLTEPNAELRKKSKSVKPEDVQSTEILSLISDLKETMVVENGIGIAAPQVGVHKKIIIIGIGDDPQAFINPKVVSRSFRKVVSEEGCLSIPGVYGMVKRSRKVKVEALNEDGDEVTLNAEGLSAVVLQHEIDHLSGILFIDKVREFTNRPRM